MLKFSTAEARKKLSIIIQKAAVDKDKDSPYPSGQGTGSPGPHGRHEIPGRVGRSSGPGRSPGGFSRSQG